MQVVHHHGLPNERKRAYRLKQFWSIQTVGEKAENRNGEHKKRISAVHPDHLGDRGTKVEFSLRFHEMVNECLESEPGRRDQIDYIETEESADLGGHNGLDHFGDLQ